MLAAGQELEEAGEEAGQGEDEEGRRGSWCSQCRGSLQEAVVATTCWHLQCRRCWLQQLVSQSYGQSREGLGGSRPLWTSLQNAMTSLKISCTGSAWRMFGVRGGDQSRTPQESLHVIYFCFYLVSTWSLPGLLIIAA